MKKKLILEMLSGFLGNKKGIFLAGHFSLVSFEGKVFPGIYEGRYRILPIKIREDIKNGMLPLEKIFRFTLKILNKRSKIILLVGDRKLYNNNKSLCEKFYEKNLIPIAYELELARYKRCPTDSIWAPPAHITMNNSNRFVSERVLINQFKQARYARCSLEQSCAQEFYPLIDEICKTEYEIMINFIPASCTGAILEATQEFRSSVTSSELDIVNVFLNGAFSKKKMWKKAEVFFNNEQKL
jgi:hypothetical protein